jgi:DNA polymerase III alpha subunit
VPAESVRKVLNERRGRYSTLSDFTWRAKLPAGEVAALVHGGCFDCMGKGRPALLEEGKLTRCPAPLPVAEAWPFQAPPPGLPDADLLKDEWHVLGFFSDGPLLSLWRRWLPSGMPTSRDLDSLDGQEASLAGLLALSERSRRGEPRLTFADEHGLFEVWLAAGVEPPEGMGAWTIRGRVEGRHGAAVVMASRVERVLPGGSPPVRLFEPGNEAS